MERTHLCGVLFTAMTKASNTFYIVSFFFLFLSSTTILLIASTAQSPVPAWGGYLDVSIVVLIAILGFLIYGRDQSTPRYEISHQIPIYLFPITPVWMWLVRGALDFNTLLPGLAWRIYFFLSILPHALSLWKLDRHP